MYVCWRCSEQSCGARMKVVSYVLVLNKIAWVWGHDRSGSGKVCLARSCHRCRWKLSGFKKSRLKVARLNRVWLKVAFARDGLRIISPGFLASCVVMAFFCCGPPMWPDDSKVVCVWWCVCLVYAALRPYPTCRFVFHLRPCFLPPFLPFLPCVFISFPLRC